MIVRAAKVSGAIRLVRGSQWRNDRLLVLCYHGVSMHDEHEWSPELFVSADHLRNRLRFLQRGGYNILPLAEAVTRLYSGTLPPRAVAITFDDGGIDFVRAALPILEEFRTPVTLYLTTYYSRKQLPVFDTMLRYVLWTGRMSHTSPPALADCGITLHTGDAAARDQTWRALFNYAEARELNAVERNALVARVAHALGVDYAALVARGTLQIMPPDTIRDLPSDLVDVQLHTHRHRVPRDRASFVREIHDNAAAISSSRGTDRPLEHFAYPSGVYHHDAMIWLRECGVRYATTCHTDLASRNTDPLLLPRFFDTMLQSPAVFESWVSGFLALLPRSRASMVELPNPVRTPGRSGDICEQTWPKPTESASTVHQP